MTEEQIKERLSVGFMRLVANRSGCIATSFDQDFGCDLTINQVYNRNGNGRPRFLKSGKYLDLQLKCTTEGQIVYESQVLKYDLESKTYNDLVDRRNDITPLFLVVMVLPDDPMHWLSLTSSEMIVRKSAYWYLPDVGTSPTSNKTSIRISIPIDHAIGPTFVADRLAEVFK